MTSFALDLKNILNLKYKQFCLSSKAGIKCDFTHTQFGLSPLNIRVYNKTASSREKMSVKGVSSPLNVQESSGCSLCLASIVSYVGLALFTERFLFNPRDIQWNSRRETKTFKRSTL